MDFKSDWDLATQLNTQVLDEYGQKDGTKMIALLAGYKDVPPDIDTFIDDKRFMGNMLGANVYPEWRQQLRAVYPNPFRSPYYQVIAAGAIGIGKGILSSSNVMGPNGVVTAGEVKVGDLLMNPDGGSTKVMGVYPQGKRKVYDITFHDGTVVRCDGNHLWTVWISMRKYKKKRKYLHDGADCTKMQVLSTEELIEGRKHLANHMYQRHYLIPMTEPTRFATRSLGFDPYLLGLLLGDGSFTDHGLSLTSMDDEIVNYVSQHHDCRIDDGLSSTPGVDLRSLTFRGASRAHIKDLLVRWGLWNKCSDDKFIPKAYLHAPVEQRVALLQGLLDTDGDITKDGGISFNSVSPQLADGVKWLVESLGGWASINSKIGSYRDKLGNKIDCKLCYRLYIQLPDKSIAFRLSRKKARTAGANFDKGREHSRLFRKIVSIEEAGEDETVCFRVDHPNRMFLLDRFVVTHNSTLSLGIMGYDLCKLTYVVNPQLTYQLLPSQEIVVGLFNATKTLAERVLMQPFSDWLLSSPYFREEMAKLREHHKSHNRRTKTTQLFRNNLGMVPASRSGDILGMACIGGVISELEFMDRVKSQAPEVYRQVQRRMSSRFERGEGYLEPGHLVVDSSARYAEGFQAKLMAEARRDIEQKTLIVEKAIWEVLEPAGKITLSGKRFKLFVGDAGGREPLILDPRQSYTLPEALCIDVPEEYRKYFVNDIYGAIRDFAGKSTVNIHKFFTNINLLKECMPESDVNPCKSTVVELDFYDEQDRLINHVDLSKLVKGVPYYIHIDIGVTGCKTGIALTRPSETKLINRIGIYLENNYVQDVVFRTDLLLAIGAKPGQEVPIAKLRNFIIDLRHHGFRIECVSYDQFQSRQLHQELDTYGISNELVSVDRHRDAYDAFKNIVSERRWSGPYHPILEHELVNLVDTGLKIVKPDEVDASFSTESTTKTSDSSISKDEEKKRKPSKDVADALVGSVFLAKEKCGSHAGGAALDAYVRHMETTERKLQLQDHIFELAKANRSRFFR